MRTSAITLTTRDLAIVETIGRYKFLSTPQIEQRFFPGRDRTIPRDRLTKLTRAGYLSRVFAFPKATANPKGGHPTAVYYLSPENLKALRLYLEARARADEYEPLQHLAATDNHTAQFSHLYLAHELGISDFFLALETATAAHGWTIPFWERTSPFREGVKETLQVLVTRTKNGTKTTTSEKRSFNPDGFFALQDPSGTTDYFLLEMDMNTSSPLKYRTKLEGYVAYHEQEKFPRLLALYHATYGLNTPPTSKPSFRVLTVTPNAQRRNSLYCEAQKLKKYKQFLFASMDDITQETILTPVWLRGKEYPALAPDLATIPEETSTAIYSRMLYDLINQKHPRVALMGA
jgi:hypothetical protein